MYYGSVLNWMVLGAGNELALKRGCGRFDSPRRAAVLVYRYLAAITEQRT